MSALVHPHAGSQTWRTALPEADANADPLPAPAQHPHAHVLHRPEADNRVRWQPGERLQHLFEQRCDAYAADAGAPHLAVESDEASLTYAELDGRANQLARCLRQHGVGAGDVVALLFDKTVHSYVAMLAVLKVHAAYVPLDGGFPADRIAFILGDAGARLVLTTASHRALLQDCGAALLCVDEAGDALAAQPATRLGEAEAGVATSELCYIIYTSGSTGRPKGVPIEHASICNFVRVAAEVYGYQPADRVYQGLTLAFDFAVEEIWVPLVVGATLLPNQSGSSLLGADLAAFLQQRRATALCCVPTLLATVEDELPALRLLIVSGEACPRDLVERWHRPGRVMLNAYGPTETTVTATLGTLQPGEPVTIGRPLPTYSIVILEPERNEALPFGALGEIGIAGVGVARGYINRDEQTRKAFIADFLDIPGNPSQRIYRTGDLGRINADGLVEYHGRIDTQVKIRGYRIELAEIESVLMQLDGVAQAVVSTHEASPGLVELAAYYTWSDPARGPSARDVAGDLRALLPGYMVPAFYERLERMPLLASDKADRRALPKPSGERLNAAQRDHVEPADDMEAGIAHTLAGVLNLERVSVEDHFFDHLGANSLLMARFSARLRDLPGLAACSMKDIYLHPTVRALAALLREPLPDSAASGTPTPTLPVHEASELAYIGCGALQLMLGLGYLLLNAWLFYEGTVWMLDARDLLAAYGRAVAFGAASFALLASLPVLLKWLLIGSWAEADRVIPVWSLSYVSFWAVRQLVQANPMVLFAGSPLFIAYLRSLGARVSWQAAVFSTHVPVCTDLVSIGAGAVVTKTAYLTSYRAEGNRIHTGAIDIGRDTYVGEASVLDIDTAMADGSQLGHASSLQRGQRLRAGRRYHGSPAQETSTAFEQLERGHVSLARRIGYSFWQLAALTLLYLPLPLLLSHFVFSRHGGGPAWAEALAASAAWADAPLVAAGAAGFYAASVIGGLLLVLLVPRLLKPLLKADVVYPLYGFHYVVHRHLSAFSNAKFYNELFGDSSYVVHYLRALGYRFLGIAQTGSNFGMGQHHDSPFLCEIGKGTMVSDGLTMANVDLSNASFRLSRVTIPPNSFLGNTIVVPAQARLGPDCLLGTKVAVPVDGPLRSGVGLLGSPCFEIPRSVRRDRPADAYAQEPVRLQRLRQKNVSNLVTMALLLAMQCGIFSASTVFWNFTYFEVESYGAIWLAVLTLVNQVFLTLYLVLVDRLSLGFGRLQPQHCSIYDDYFWHHERHWKLGLSGDRLTLRLLNGTPFKGLAWRLLGVRVGKQLFDDGSFIVEKTLVSLGDHCCLNDRSVIHSHSLEDGTFKSDRIVIRDRCTVGTGALVHYGVELEDGVCIEPDAFLMKGEHPAAHSRWCGNPACEIRRAT